SSNAAPPPGPACSTSRRRRTWPVAKKAGETAEVWKAAFDRASAAGNRPLHGGRVLRLLCRLPGALGLAGRLDGLALLLLRSHRLAVRLPALAGGEGLALRRIARRRRPDGLHLRSAALGRGVLRRHRRG